MVFCMDQVPPALQTRHGASGIRQAPVPRHYSWITVTLRMIRKCFSTEVFYYLSRFEGAQQCLDGEVFLIFTRAHGYMSISISFVLQLYT
jgi:hypothetical protein